MIMLHPTRLTVALTDHGGPHCSTNGPIHQIIALDQDNTFFSFIYCICTALKLFFILMLYQLDMARNYILDHLLPECPLPFASCFPLPLLRTQRNAIRIIVPQIDSRRIDFARLRSIIADRPPRRSDSLPSLSSCQWRPWCVGWSMYRT